MAHTSHPLLRDRQGGQAPVSDSELLFDLIYVFSVTQLSHYLLHYLSWEGLGQAVILWFAVWLAWQHTVWVTNWFDPATRSIRMLLFVLMILGLVMAAAIPGAYAGRGLTFAGAYVAMQVGRTAVILILLDKRHLLTPNFRRMLGWFGISAAGWLAGAFSEDTARWMWWLAAAAIDYTSPMFGFWLPGLGRSVSRKEWTVEGEHLAERSRLFVIIAFGETILMTGSSFSELDAWSGPVIATTLLSFICSLAMWWVYFDIAGEAGSLKIKKTSDPGLLGLKYQSVHVVLVGSLIGCAVGDELAIRHPFDRPTVPVLLTMVGAPMIYLASNVVYKWLISKQIAWSHLGAMGLLGVLFFVSSRFTLLGLNGCVTLVFIGVVVYETIRFRHPDIEEIVGD